MKPFDQLSGPGQFRRLTPLARAALAQWDVQVRSMRALTHFENATWRVETNAGTHLLRVHRPGYRSAQQLRSECQWLDALRAADVPTQRARPSAAGDVLVQARAPGVPEPRWCTLLSWLPGQHRVKGSRPVHWHALGDLVARMHRFAETWRPGPPFDRPHFDHSDVYRLPARTGVPAVDDLLSPADWDLWTWGLQHRQAVCAEIGTGPAQWGLVHNDCHMHNVLFHRGQAQPIDFDDGGWGHYLLGLTVPWHRAKRLDHADAAWAAFVAAYRARRPLSASDLARIPEMATLERLMIARWLAGQQRFDWARTHTQRILDEVVVELRALRAKRG